MKNEFWHFITAKFEVILLSFFVMYFSFYIWRAAHFGLQDIVTYGTDNGKLFVGALLGMLTGRAIQRAVDTSGGNNGKTNGSNSTPPTLPPGVQPTSGAGSA